MSGSSDLKVSELREAQTLSGSEAILMVQEGENVQARSGLLIEATTSLLVARDFATRAAAQAGKVAAPVMAIRTVGYYEPYDGGGAQYVRVAARPPHGEYIEQDDGSLWELSDPVADARAFGARGTDGMGAGNLEVMFDDHDALQRGLNWSAATGFILRIQPPRGGRFRVTKPLYVPPAANVIGGDDGALDFLPGSTAQDPPGRNMPRSLIRGDFGPDLHTRAVMYVGPQATVRGITVQGYRGDLSSESCNAIDTKEFSGLRKTVGATPESQLMLPYSMPTTMRIFVGGVETAGATFSTSPVRNQYAAGTVITLPAPVSNTVVSISPGVGAENATLQDVSAVFGWDNFSFTYCRGIKGSNLVSVYAGQDGVLMGAGCTDAEIHVSSSGSGRHALNATACFRNDVRGIFEQSGGCNINAYNINNFTIRGQLDVSNLEGVRLGLVGDTRMDWVVRRSCYTSGIAHIRFIADCWDLVINGVYQQGVKLDTTAERIAYLVDTPEQSFAVPFDFPTGGLTVTVNGQDTAAYTISGTPSGGIYPAGSSVVLNAPVQTAQLVIYKTSGLKPDYCYLVDAGVTLHRSFEVGAPSAQRLGIHADAHTESQVIVLADRQATGGGAASVHPGYRPGAWYGRPTTSFVSGTMSGGAGGAANSIIYAVPIEIERDVVMDRIGLVIATSTPGVNAKFALYANDPDTALPGDLIEDCPTAASLGGASGSQASAALEAATALTRSCAWLAVMFDGAAVVNTFNPASTGAALLATIFGGPSITNLTTATASTGIAKVVSSAVDYAAGFPATFPSPAPAANTPGAPYLAWRAA